MTDDGIEFTGKTMKDFFRKNSFEHHICNSKQEAAIAERFNSTIKSFIYQYFTLEKNRHWLNIRYKLAQPYNLRLHRSLKIAPIDVDYSI